MDVIGFWIHNVILILPHWNKGETYPNICITLQILLIVWVASHMTWGSYDQLCHHSTTSHHYTMDDNKILVSEDKEDQRSTPHPQEIPCPQLRLRPRDLPHTTPTPVMWPSGHVTLRLCDQPLNPLTKTIRHCWNVWVCFNFLSVRYIHQYMFSACGKHICDIFQTALLKI